MAWLGLGESGAWGYLEASAAAVETFKRYLIGQDPLRIEHHWQYLYRWTHFRGRRSWVRSAPSTSRFGTLPESSLMCRPINYWAEDTRKARVYYHVFGDTKEKLIQGCRDAKRQGFTAVGHLTPFLG